MKTYLLDIIPKIQRFSQKLDNLTILLDKHWVILDEDSKNKSVFIFRERNNQLLISNNGKIEKGMWEYLGNNSLLIDRENGSFLFKHGFIDECVLALKVDGKEEYALLVNEQWFENQIKSLETLLSFLNKKYIDQKMNSTISFPDLDEDYKKQINKLPSSVNNFLINWNDISIPEKVQKDIGSDIAFLKYSLQEIDYYIKFFRSTKYPFYAALKLDFYRVKITPEALKNLERIAKREFGQNTINDALITIANNE